jgi:hypothetical protein
MFCENCGTQLPDNSVFCTECGNKIALTGNETQKPSSKGQPVPPVMRQKAPRHPSEPYRKEATPRHPSESYRREAVQYQPSESYVGASADIIGVGKYILMIFLAGIPIVNIILLIKWGFINKQSPNKSNFAKALLFYYLVAVIIYVAYIYLWLKATSSI